MFDKILVEGKRAYNEYSALKPEVKKSGEKFGAEEASVKGLRAGSRTDIDI